MVTNERNAFTALCGLAAKENWCWNIFCTTCGHTYFRYGLLELARGRHPLAGDWREREANHHILKDKLGPLPRHGQWSLKHQKILSSVFANASLKDIALFAKFPDWLGYVGIGLFYTEDIERGRSHIDEMN